ncbi:MAG: hypothetical protein ACP5F6_06840 [Microbacter sp.]
MKTKLSWIVILTLFPLLGFSQSFYDDIYNPKAQTTNQSKVQQQPTQNNTNANQEYQIETANVGHHQAVIVRNAAGDTVYYSDDYANTNNQPNGTVLDTIAVNGSTLQPYQSTNKANLLLQLSNGSVYPVDQINWNVNVWGGYPYYNSWWQPYWYNSFYPFGYAYNPYCWSSWYGDYWDAWDLNWGFGWNSPYYYGWNPYYWGGYPYYYGGLYYGGYTRPIPYNYTENSRRSARMPSNNLQSTYYNNGTGSGSIAVNGTNASTGRTMGTAVIANNRAAQSTTSNTATINQPRMVNARQNNTVQANPIDVRGTEQNRVFWSNFLRQNGYNVDQPRIMRNGVYSNENNVQPNNNTSRRVVIIRSQNNENQVIEREKNYRVQRSNNAAYEQQQQRVERPVYNENRSFNYAPSYNNGGGRSEGSFEGGGGGRGGRR